MECEFKGVRGRRHTDNNESKADVVAIVFIFTVAAIIILTAGSPDLLDAIIKRVGGF